MLVKAIKGFLHDKRGAIAKDQVIEVSDSEGARLKRMRLVNPAGPADAYHTKVIQREPLASNPIEAGGEDAQLSASLPAQASPQTTVKESESGKKRGRPKTKSS